MKQEKNIVWGLVVEGDEVWSPKTRKWYPVSGSVSVKDTGTVKVFINGRQLWPAMNAKDPVRVRRGPTGEAVDVIQLVFSAQTMPEEK